MESAVAKRKELDLQMKRLQEKNRSGASSVFIRDVCARKTPKCKAQRPT